MTPHDPRRNAAAPARSRSSRVVQVAFRLLTLLVPLVLLVAVAEVAIRLIVPAERWRLVDATDHWRVDPDLGWVYGSNLDSFSIDLMTNEAIPLRTNADGLLPSSAVPEKTPGVIRILLVGDSTIVGSAVREEHRIHTVLQRLLTDRGLAVEVLNAGTEGFATDQAMLRLEKLIEPYAPDIVLHGVCSNDLVANTLSENHGLNKPSFRVDAEGELSPNPFTASAAIREKDSGPAAMIQHSALYRLLRPRIVVLRAKLGGWEARNLIGMASDWYHDESVFARIDWPLLGALVARMADTANAHDAAFAAYLHPDVGATWDPVIEDTRASIGPDVEFDRYALERRVGQEIGRHGVVFLPLVRQFAEQQERGPFHLLPRDPHCNAEGYSVQAEALAEFVRQALERQPTAD